MPNTPTNPSPADEPYNQDDDALMKYVHEEPAQTVDKILKELFTLGWKESARNYYSSDDYREIRKAKSALQALLLGLPELRPRTELTEYEYDKASKVDRDIDGLTSASNRTKADIRTAITNLFKGDN